MGCNTRCHKRIDVTYDEAKEYFVNERSKNIALLERFIANPDDEQYIMMSSCSWYGKDFAMDKMIYDVALYKRQLRVVEAGLCKEAVMSRFAGYRFETGEAVYYIKGKGHYVQTRPHQPFACWHFPEDQLFSMQETLDFIDRNKDKIHYYHEDYMTMLEKFWQENPDGMIDFG